MASQLLPSHQIARLHYQSAHFAEAVQSIEIACQESLAAKNISEWLECQRIRVQCLAELTLLSQIDKIEAELLRFLNENPEASEVATAEYILGMLLLHKGQRSEAQGYFQTSISKVTLNKNLRTLAYALYAEAFLAASGPSKNLSKTALNIEKIEIITGQDNLQELAISTQLLKCFVHTERGEHDLALHLLWAAYEAAKGQGMTVVISSILAQMARIHESQGQQSLHKIYSDLALCGVDPVKHPRLFRQISAVNPNTAPRRQHDIEVDEHRRMILERRKGVIHFGNQHILLDMALLLIKNPGIRYSKSDLITAIWKELYDPSTHDNLIYVSIKRLRNLLEPEEQPHYLLKDRRGYYFNPLASIQFKTAENHA